jgi:hypothetical protein
MKKEFVIERQGKSFVLYAGLLDEAHQQGLKSITTKLLQIPTDENGHLAVAEATVTTDKGTYSGIGDASPQNVTKMMQCCLIRMAETRAKARALRDAVNVGVAAFEELGEDILVDDGFESSLEDVQQRTLVGPSENVKAEKLVNRPATATILMGQEITDKQLKAIYAIARTSLGLSEEEVDSKSQQLYGRLPAGLTRRDASAFIDLLKRKAA